MRKVEVKAGDEAVVNGLGNAKAILRSSGRTIYSPAMISWLDHSLIISVPRHHNAPKALDGVF